MIILNLKDPLRYFFFSVAERHRWAVEGKGRFIDLNSQIHKQVERKMLKLGLKNRKAQKL